LGPNRHGRADIDLLRKLRQNSDLPVILTDRGDDAGERIVALELGADDYLRQPFDPRELLARIRSFERRWLNPGGGLRAPQAYVFAGWTLVPQCMQLVDPQGRTVRLTATEHRLLLALVSSPRRVLSRARLLSSLGNLNEESTERSIDMMIWRLRRKLSANLIRTERNVGYMLSAQVDSDCLPPGVAGQTAAQRLHN
ncbi:MAG: winged helix-turn-helix domain-containing protein, partial [Lysobacterales bacterium]